MKTELPQQTEGTRRKFTLTGINSTPVSPGVNGDLQIPPGFKAQHCWTHLCKQLTACHFFPLRKALWDLGSKNLFQTWGCNLASTAPSGMMDRLLWYQKAETLTTTGTESPKLPVTSPPHSEQPHWGSSHTHLSPEPGSEPKALFLLPPHSRFSPKLLWQRVN